MKKDFNWSVSGINYIVRNVPHEMSNTEGGASIDIGDAVKLGMIRDMMYENIIPHDVNFDLVANFKFSEED